MMYTKCLIFLCEEQVDQFTLDGADTLRLQDVVMLALKHRKLFGFLPSCYVIPTGIEWSTAFLSEAEHSLSGSFFGEVKSFAKTEGLSGTAGFLEFTLSTES